jgi:hypothetical protein
VVRVRQQFDRLLQPIRHPFSSSPALFAIIIIVIDDDDLDLNLTCLYSAVQLHLEPPSHTSICCLLLKHILSHSFCQSPCQSAVTVHPNSLSHLLSSSVPSLPVVHRHSSDPSHHHHHHPRPLVGDSESRSNTAKQTKPSSPQLQPQAQPRPLSIRFGWR